MLPSTEQNATPVAAPCDGCIRLARFRAERLACSSAQAFYFGSTRLTLAPRLDASRWRREFLAEGWKPTKRERGEPRPIGIRWDKDSLQRPAGTIRVALD